MSKYLRKDQIIELLFFISDTSKSDKNITSSEVVEQLMLLIDQNYIHKSLVHKNYIKKKYVNFEMLNKRKRTK